MPATIERFKAEVSQIIARRSITIARSQQFQLIALAPSHDGVYPRLATYRQQVFPAGTLFSAMCAQLLNDNEVFGDEMFSSGMFIDGLHMDELNGLIDGTTPPEDPL
jgi:hypothetical protein